MSLLKWSGFLVWLGPLSHFLERFYTDNDFRLKTVLPALQGFYAAHAIPYLQVHKRPACKGDSPLNLQTSLLSELEMVLRFNCWQSRLDGRNGSNACTIIAGLFVREFLRNPAINLSVAVLCQIMKDGSAACDHLNTYDLLSADEVVAIQPSLGIEMCGE